ncbi:MAG: GreA/GreB family elongation factor, partial [Chloroflexales bacterium]|nr:GreA/GreB family elongation factor [Chloroflexales bacterium]
LAAPAGPQVQRGSRVRVVFDDDTTETYTIVRQEETNRQRNLIGENSPLGAALLGAIVGEMRAFRVRPAGPEQMVEVLEID